jgi:hypothetical protein
VTTMRINGFLVCLTIGLAGSLAHGDICWVEVEEYCIDGQPSGCDASCSTPGADCGRNADWGSDDAYVAGAIVTGDGYHLDSESYYQIECGGWVQCQCVENGTDEG